MSVSPAAAEAARRRTFAVISHPDAGKSTLTEALALHARAAERLAARIGPLGFLARELGAEVPSLMTTLA